MKRLAMLAFVAAAPFLAGCYHRHVYVYHNVVPMLDCVGPVQAPNCGQGVVNGYWVEPQVTVVPAYRGYYGPHVVIAPPRPHFPDFGWHHFPFFNPIPCR